MTMQGLRSLCLALIACTVLFWVPLALVVQRYASPPQEPQEKQVTYLRSEMDGLKKEVADLKKLVLIYKHAVLKVKEKGLNADQDIQRMVSSALDGGR
jgi:uncharacterized protein YlxW (UPF0749 family)